MTLEEMKELYVKTTQCSHRKNLEGSLFTVRVYDGFDNRWVDVVAGVELQEALENWLENTEDGTKHTRYEHIDYYAIFPADTKMLYSGDFPMNER